MTSARRNFSKIEKALQEILDKPDRNLSEIKTFYSFIKEKWIALSSATESYVDSLYNEDSTEQVIDKFTEEADGYQLRFLTLGSNVTDSIYDKETSLPENNAFVVEKTAKA